MLRWEIRKTMDDQEKTTGLLATGAGSWVEKRSPRAHSHQDPWGIELKGRYGTRTRAPYLEILELAPLLTEIFEARFAQVFRGHHGVERDFGVEAEKEGLR